MDFYLNKENNGNEIYCVCNSDLIGEIKFCKSYNESVIDLKCESLKNIGIDEWKIKTEIQIDFDYIGEDVNYVSENVELFKKKH